MVTGLTDDDLRRFAVDGWLVVPGVVPESLLAEADAEIDELVATEKPQEDPGGPGAHLWFPPVARLPRCDAVLRSSDALAIAEGLVAPLGLDHAFDHIQVATTVPPWDHVPGGPHIDGHAPTIDPPASFTMLAGVFLTDQRSPSTGNLWVWPGSHRDHSTYFHEHGTRALQWSYGHATLLAPPARLRSPTAVPVLGGRGDLLLAHFLLGHNKGGNTADHVRRTIYYRLAAPGHPDRWESTFLDPLTEYAPVRRALGDDGATAITTERLRLRPISTDDADLDLLVALDADPEVLRYLALRPSTRAQVEAMARRSIGHRWIATDRDDGSFVGWFSLHPTAGRTYELGYRLVRSAWGRGLATEGGRALVRRAFADLGAERVFAQTMAVNAASRRVMERCGLTYERTFHLEWDEPLPGAEEGEVEYALARDDWLRVLTASGGAGDPDPGAGA